MTLSMQNTLHITLARVLPRCLCTFVLLISNIALADKPRDFDQIMSSDDTRHFLARTGIGVSPADYLQYHKLTRRQAIDTLLAQFTIDPSTSYPAWVGAPVPHYHARQDLDDSARALFNNDRNAELSQLRVWWVREMLQTPSPQTERMVLFWHDVFATNYQGIGLQSLAMARQNQTFRTLGMGSWQVLLKAMIRDPALLRYLDAGSNHKKSPNENLARELLELFTLGVGNYNEGTVKEAARTLTGHNTSQLHDLAFLFRGGRHDTGSKNLFGVTGEHRGDDLIELVLAQPAAGRFLAGKFWQAFVSDTAPEERWIESVANTFRASGLDVVSLYRAMLESDEFWQEQYRGALIKSPVDIIVGTARSLEYPKVQWRQFANWQRTLGMDLFAPPNVSGWKEGGSFITPGHLLNRYKYVNTLVKSDAALQTAAARDAGVGMAMTSSQPAMGMKGADMASKNMAIGEMAGKNMAGEEMAGTQMAGDEMAGTQMAGDEIAGTDRVSGNPVGSGLMSPDQPTSTTARVKVKLAAEDFQGPVDYQVSVFAGDDELWQSDTMVFLNGVDTELEGRVTNASDFNWITQPIDVPNATVDRATHVNVTYLNDAAGPGGDRNLYIEGISVDKHWFDSSDAYQSSECPPELSANAGNLYCAGSVRFNLQTMPEKIDDSLPAWRAAAVHVASANDNVKANRQHVTLTLDHVSTPDRDFHTLQFVIITAPEGYDILRLDSYGCWPSCVEVWPECAWQDPLFEQSKRLHFPRRPSSDVFWESSNPTACQHVSLDPTGQRLAGMLWNNVEHLLMEASTTHRAQRFMPIIDKVLAHLQGNPIAIQDTPYAGDFPVFQVNHDYAPAYRTRLPLADIQPAVNSEKQLYDLLQSVDLSVNSLLMPFYTDNAEGLLPISAWVSKPEFQLK